MSTARAVAGARIGWGVGLVIIPARMAAVLGLSAGRQPSRGETMLCRALGVRHVVQGMIGAVVPRRPVLEAGFVVDVLHALSMAAYAASGRDRRRAALDAALAGGWAVLGWRALRRAPGSRGAGQRAV